MFLRRRRTRATVELHLRLSPRVKIVARKELKCWLSLKEYDVQGMAGPIPVYGSMRPNSERRNEQQQHHCGAKDPST